MDSKAAAGSTRAADTAIESGLVRVGVGAAAEAKTPPAIGSVMNPLMSLEPLFATYTNRPDGSIAIPRGAVPTPKGDPPISVNTPLFCAIANADSVPSASLVP